MKKKEKKEKKGRGYRQRRGAESRWELEPKGGKRRAPGRGRPRGRYLVLFFK